VPRPLKNGYRGEIEKVWGPFLGERNEVISDSDGPASGEGAGMEGKEKPRLGLTCWNQTSNGIRTKRFRAKTHRT